jgi:hypothetical protein
MSYLTRPRFHPHPIPIRTPSHSSPPQNATHHRLMTRGPDYVHQVRRHRAGAASAPMTPPPTATPSPKSPYPILSHPIPSTYQAPLARGPTVLTFPFPSLPFSPRTHSLLRRGAALQTRKGKNYRPDASHAALRLGPCCTPDADAGVLDAGECTAVQCRAVRGEGLGTPWHSGALAFCDMMRFDFIARLRLR